MGFGAALRHSWCAGRRPQSCTMWRSTQRRFETRAMQAFWERVHARASGRSAHGFFGGILRSVLQLRTPQGSGGAASLTEKPAEPDLSLRTCFRDSQIEMAHGAGGKASRRLVEGLFAPLLFGSSAEPLTDSARVLVARTSAAVTTDSFVVSPLSFPGGSIGELAINGTVNDLAVSGARPEAIVVTFILEAGLPASVLESEVRAMADAARRANVKVVGGDTKVVEHGKADLMYVTATGIGS